MGGTSRFSSPWAARVRRPRTLAAFAGSSPVRCRIRTLVSRVARATSATAHHPASDMGLGSTPHSLNVTPFWPSALKDACQSVQRACRPEHNLISVHFEDQYRSRPNLQVFPHTPGDGHLPLRCDFRCGSHRGSPYWKRVSLRVQIVRQASLGVNEKWALHAGEEFCAMQRIEIARPRRRGSSARPLVCASIRCDDLLAILLEPVVDPAPVQASQAVVNVLGAGRAILVVVGVLEDIAGHQGNAAPDGPVVVLVH